MREVEPSLREVDLAAAHLRRPTPYDRSPIRHLAMLLAAHREGLLEQLELTARRVEPACAAEIRGCIERLRETEKGPTT